MTGGCAGPVSIALFGPLIVRKDGMPVTLPITGHTLELLKFFLTNARKPYRRDYLSELFWPDTCAKRKRSALNTAIWRIRSQVSNRVDVHLLSEADCTSLEIGPDVEVDSVELANALSELQGCGSAGPEAEAESRLARALETSDQPFLDGLNSDWALSARQKFSEVKARALALMMRRCGASQRYDQAIDYGLRLLEADPYREDTHCEMMCLYVLSGRRAHAVRQYHRCAELLQDELGVEPMPEMQLLHQHITEGGEEPGANALAPEDCDRRNVAPLFAALARSRTDVYSALCQQLP